MFRNEAAEFVFIRTYARWIEKLGRREISWSESADRLLEKYWKYHGSKIPRKTKKRIEYRLKKMDAMPSMRALWAAGPALEENAILAYNCGYLPISDIFSFAELLYILMCGTGVGFSVEEENIRRLPTIKPQTGDGAGVYVVEDSKEGWARSLYDGLKAWFDGKDLEFDYTKIRPRGARLKTMGGRASGPGPLQRLHSFSKRKILEAQGRQLTALECHDLCCMVADVVVVGGVRRSSLISFSDLDSKDMREAKNGDMPVYRYMANNSAVYKNKPDMITFMQEWLNLAKSGSGERGIYNISKLSNYAPRRSFPKGGGELPHRSNPCGEIILRPYEFCNLTEVVVRASDSFDDLIEKVEAAVWMGAIQSTWTHFKFIRPEWRKNCEEERLMGVSLTGQMDNPNLLTSEKLDILKKYAIKTAKKACRHLSINMSVSISTGKPSGTVSQVVDCASGCHPRWSQYQIRRYRISATDPLYRMMKDQKVTFEPEKGHRKKDWETAEKLCAEGKHFEQVCPIYERGEKWSESKVLTWVVAFPVKAPVKAITRHAMDAIQQLEWYKKVQENWCEHNQSCTVYVRDDEWLKVGSWVYENFDNIVGIAFLPATNMTYELAPNEEITKEEYEKRKAEFPKIDYTQLSKYELEDVTTGAQNLACTGNMCELS